MPEQLNQKQWIKILKIYQQEGMNNAINHYAFMKVMSYNNTRKRQKNLKIYIKRS